MPTLFGHDTSGLKVKGTIHWLDAKTAVKAEARIYNPLFNVENPSAEEGDFKQYINRHSLEVKEVFIEPDLEKASHGEHFQFMRNGYFCVDSDSKPGAMVFNRTVGLKEGFKIAAT